MNGVIYYRFNEDNDIEHSVNKYDGDGIQYKITYSNCTISDNITDINGIKVYFFVDAIGGDCEELRTKLGESEENIRIIQSKVDAALTDKQEAERQLGDARLRMTGAEQESKQAKEELERTKQEVESVKQELERVKENSQSLIQTEKERLEQELGKRLKQARDNNKFAEEKLKEADRIKELADENVRKIEETLKQRDKKVSETVADKNKCIREKGSLEQEALQAKQEAEQAKQEAEQAKQEAEQAKQEAEQVKQEALQAKQEALQAKQKIAKQLRIVNETKEKMNKIKKDCDEKHDAISSQRKKSIKTPVIPPISLPRTPTGTPPVSPPRTPPGTPPVSPRMDNLYNGNKLIICNGKNNEPECIINNINYYIKQHNKLKKTNSPLVRYINIHPLNNNFTQIIIRWYNANRNILNVKYQNTYQRIYGERYAYMKKLFSDVVTKSEISNFWHTNIRPKISIRGGKRKTKKRRRKPKKQTKRHRRR